MKLTQKSGEIVDYIAFRLNDGNILRCIFAPEGCYIRPEDTVLCGTCKMWADEDSREVQWELECPGYSSEIFISADVLDDGLVDKIEYLCDWEGDRV